jgi:hypothetical protein
MMRANMRRCAAIAAWGQATAGSVWASFLPACKREKEMAPRELAAPLAIASMAVAD